MNKSIVEVLKEAKQLIQDPKNWIQDYAGQDTYGMPVGITACMQGEAICFCSLGALAAVTKDPVSTARAFFEITMETDYEKSVAQFNDNHTHAEVMELWDKVIAAAEAKGV